jgi:hypothetical protein
MTESDSGVPTLAPHELTYRVGVEVIECTAEQLTVRCKRLFEPDAADSDGIPQAVEAEVSVRGSSGHVTDQYGLAHHITPEIRLIALEALVEFADRDGKRDLLDRPFLISPEWKNPLDLGRQEVCLGIWKRETFEAWFDELAQFDFADIERYMKPVHGSSNWIHLRRVCVQVLHELKGILLTIQRLPDTPHTCVHL